MVQGVVRASFEERARKSGGKRGLSCGKNHVLHRFAENQNFISKLINRLPVMNSKEAMAAV